MAWFSNYIIAVVAAAIICSTVRVLVGNKSAPAAIVKLITGLLLTVTMITPLTNIKFSDISNYIDDFSLESDAVVDVGSSYAAEKTAAIIKARTEAYILDKAQVLGANVVTHVILSNDPPYKPCSVTMTGNVSPYAKQRLMAFITQDLGISEVDQIWN